MASREGRIKAQLRALPAVGTLLADPRVQAWGAALPPGELRERVRVLLGQWRRRLAQEEETGGGDGKGEKDGKVAPLLSRSELQERLVAQLLADGAGMEKRFPLRRVLNATGIILHTNLGRAVLPPPVVEAVATAAAHYSNLEYDLERGERGSRQDHIAPLLCRLTGAEAALVVNNNAAAVLLCLNTLAGDGGEVIISRGEEVEIGGSFRVPEVIACSGARLVEVGTTNKTHLRDYAAAIGPATAALLKIHPSNYRLLGFTASVPLAELVALGRERGLPVLEDLGSGSFLDLRRFGLTGEPTVAAQVATGVDLLTFSGDKLLGGPQAGIILGKRELVARIARNPLTRALRVDKLTLAALAATLTLYQDEEAAIRTIPTLAFLAKDEAALEEEAQVLARLLQQALATAGLGAATAGISVVAEANEAGGGSLPGVELPGRAVALSLPPSLEPTRLLAALRQGNPAVVARVHQGRVLFHVRTLRPPDFPELVGAVVRALTRGVGGR